MRGLSAGMTVAAALCLLSVLLHQSSAARQGILSGASLLSVGSVSEGAVSAVGMPGHRVDKAVDSSLLDDLAIILVQSQARAMREHCKLLGNWFGWMIQASLGAVAFSALILKKFVDSKPRDWMTWFRDTSKQAVGSLVAHMWNLLFASMLQSKEDEDPCVYYLVNYLIDALLGCVLGLLMLWALETMADKYGWDVLRSGDYGDSGTQHETWSRWAAQLSAWIAIVTFTKLFLLFAVIVPAKQPLYIAGTWMMSGLINYPRLELVIVMILIPLVFNVLTFWVQDNFLMNNEEKHSITVDSTDTTADKDPHSHAAAISRAAAAAAKPDGDAVGVSVPIDSGSAPTRRVDAPSEETATLLQS